MSVQESKNEEIDLSAVGDAWAVWNCGELQLTATSF